MYNYQLHKLINTLMPRKPEMTPEETFLQVRLLSNAPAIRGLYQELYAGHVHGEATFTELIQTIIAMHQKRPAVLKERDLKKQEEGHWFLSNQLGGMSLYVDRFSGSIANLAGKLDYLEKLGVNLLHLMPLFESPRDESDGGYAVSNFEKVDERYGTIADLEKLVAEMQSKNMYLMLDIVLNHTSRKHAWALKANSGDKHYQDYYYFFDNREEPDEYERTMPDIFPEAAPGNFTFLPDCDKWVMTVFHNYQWDLNYRNPLVLVEMLKIILYYANLGVDILRIDAPAFIWKKKGTSSQNLPEAHTILRLIKQCVQVAAPGMALLGEAIVAPAEIIKYFGTDQHTAEECDFAYNATQMAVQWDALATGDARLMRTAWREIQKKPFGTSWITYTRSHDDIGLGYDDYMIEQSGFNAAAHRHFIKNYFTGNYPGSTSRGALFSSNPKTNDARISGTLASLCGLEDAVERQDQLAVDIAIRKILLMQAVSFFVGGLPMLFNGDEAGYTNDYSYLSDAGKNYDNRWMHRPVMDWNKADQENPVKQKVFAGTQRLFKLRKKEEAFADINNLEWMIPEMKQLVAFKREKNNQPLFCIFNFSAVSAVVQMNSFSDKSGALYDCWRERYITNDQNTGTLEIGPYDFYILKFR